MVSLTIRSGQMTQNPIAVRCLIRPYMLAKKLSNNTRTCTAIWNLRVVKNMTCILIEDNSDLDCEGHSYLEVTKGHGDLEGHIDLV